MSEPSPALPTAGLDLSIIIVSWNTSDLLRQCLESVYSKHVALEMEVLVVDNASDDGSAEMVEQEFPQVTLIRSPENLGYARANNLAIRQSRGRNVLLLNSDTVIDPAILPETIRLLRSEESIGALGCRLVGFDGREQQSYCFDFPNGPVVCEPGTPIGGGLIRCAHVWGAYLLVRREAIEQVGMLDEDFFIYYEDVDWCWRMHEAGWKVAYDRSHTITHVLHGSCVQTDPRERYRRLVLSEGLLYAKHHSAASVFLWRAARIARHGRCAAWYRLAGSLTGSKEGASKLARHRGCLRGAMELGGLLRAVRSRARGDSHSERSEESASRQPDSSLRSE